MADRAPNRIEVISPHRERILAVHESQGATNDCGPFAAAMVINAVREARRQIIGRAVDAESDGRPASTVNGSDAEVHHAGDVLNPISPAWLARVMDAPRWIGPLGIWPLVRRVPQSATFPWGLTDVLREHGIRAGWRPLVGADRLRDWLQSGDVPIVVTGRWWPRPWAHWSVVLAWDLDEGWGVADPSRPRGELRWFSESEFRRMRWSMGALAVRARVGQKVPMDRKRTDRPPSADRIRTVARSDRREEPGP